MVTSQTKFFPQHTVVRYLKGGPCYRHFNNSELRILWKLFEKNPYISYGEAQDLAEKLNVIPQKILSG